jgi:hypothetical protein
MVALALLDSRGSVVRVVAAHELPSNCATSIA